MLSIINVIVYVIVVAFLVAFRVLLTVAVARNCGYRDTNSAKLWVILTAIIGFISAVTYAVFVPKKSDKPSEKNSKKLTLKIVLIMSVTLIIFVLFLVLFAIPKMNEYKQERENSFPLYLQTYENENGEKVIYDKMGNAYTYEQWDDYKYYDKDGNAYYYRAEDDSDPAHGGTWYENIETGERYNLSAYAMFTDEEDVYYQCLFDSQGYLCFFDEKDFLYEYSIYQIDESLALCIYFDNKGNLYYTDDKICYDKNGDVVFMEESLEDFKYSDIPEEEFEIFELNN